MEVNVPVEQQPPVPQVVDDVSVGVFHELAGEGIIAGDVALKVHGLDEGQLLLPPQSQVLVAESRGDVDDAGAVFHGHEIGRDNPRM